MPDYVLYDLETTGTSSKYDEVIEISAVKVKNGVVTEEFSQLVNPGRPIPSAASAVNHNMDDMVAFAPMFDSVLQQFLAFIGDDVLAGHNINRFDMKFLYRDCERYFGQTLTNDYIDTLKLARLCLPELSHHRQRTWPKMCCQCVCLRWNIHRHFFQVLIVCNMNNQRII